MLQTLEPEKKHKTDALKNYLLQKKQKLLSLEEACESLKIENEELKDAGSTMEIWCVSSGKKGKGVWPQWIVQLILKMLHNETKPSAIRLNIESQFKVMYLHSKIHELFSTGYIQR